MNWRENSGQRLGHGGQYDVTVIWPHGSREGWNWFILDFMLSPSRAAVLEPDLKIRTMKETSVMDCTHHAHQSCQSNQIVDKRLYVFTSRQVTNINKIIDYVRLNN